MSFILDALRKADAERERGSVPGLHTQPAAAVAVEAPAHRRGPMPAVWGVAGSFVVLAVVLTWVVSGMVGPRELPAPAATVAMAPAPTAAPATPSPAPTAAATPAPIASPPPVAEARATPAPPPVVASRAPAVKPPAAPRTAAPVAAKAAGETAPAAASAADARVYAVSELPDNIRRELPPLTIGGSIYSDTPASRFLIINGQIYHEGDKVANGLSLEQIKLKAAVLRYKGWRVGISY